MSQRARLALLLGISAGFGTLIFVGWVLDVLPKGDVAIAAGCFAAVTGGLVPLMTQKPGKRCKAENSAE